MDLYVEGYYEGNPAHVVKLQQWNYTSSSWVNVTAASSDFPSRASETTYEFYLLEAGDYISDGNIKVGIIHTSNGTGTHLFHIDKFYLQLGGA